ncbi:hypothetical protein FQN50_007753 [Emmonsiellopsis sp. PD_5]|nr:hypothetical protein FQN50_007753 [Emmonsiellopsis sp. PD_5]
MTERTDLEVAKEQASHPTKHDHNTDPVKPKQSTAKRLDKTTLEDQGQLKASTNPHSIKLKISLIRWSDALANKIPETESPKPLLFPYDRTKLDMVRIFQLGREQPSPAKKVSVGVHHTVSKARKNSGFTQTVIGGQVIKSESLGAKISFPSKAKAKKETQAGPCLIVGIDFGTTYSGVSFVASDGEADRIKTIVKWPGNPDNREKVPSAIAYSGDLGEVDTWGYEALADTSTFSWFKLLMNQGGHSSNEDDPLLQQAVGAGLLKIPQGKTATELAQDYMTCLYQHVLKYLNKAYKSDIVADLPIHAILTAPADWGPEYKATLIKVAEAAGIASRDCDRISTIDEPEAAALAAFTAAQEESALNGFEPNTNAVIIDIGGGTVVSTCLPIQLPTPVIRTNNGLLNKDLITYKIISTKPFKIAEACTGTSAKCGATTIDRELHQLMESRYGAAFSGKPREEISQGSEFMNKFEVLKKTFKGCKPGKKEYHLPLLMDVDGDETYEKDAKSREISEEIAAMFEKVITPSLNLVSQQMTKTREENRDPIKTIVLCGGMADSEYVYSRFEDFCKEDLKGEVDVIVPTDSWPAIAKGAAMHGLLTKSMVQTRKCRWSYGICMHREFDPEKDIDENSLECPINGKRATEIYWYIKEGATIRENIKWFEGYLVLDTSKGKGGLIGDMEVYRSKESRPGKTVDSDDVEKMGTMRLDFSTIAQGGRNRFKAKKNLKQMVKVGHRIVAGRGVVEFYGKCASKTIGFKDFKYEAANATDK